MTTATQARTTTNHEVIRLWAEDRCGVPASVASTADDRDVGVLRIHFPGQGSGDVLDEVQWDDFFKKFDEAQLAFLYDVLSADGTLSRFCKFISRES